MKKLTLVTKIFFTLILFIAVVFISCNKQKNQKLTACNNELVTHFELGNAYPAIPKTYDEKEFYEFSFGIRASNVILSYSTPSSKELIKVIEQSMHDNALLRIGLDENDRIVCVRYANESEIDEYNSTKIENSTVSNKRYSSTLPSYQTVVNVFNYLKNLFKSS